MSQLRARVVTNSLYSVFGTFVSLLVALVSAPLVIHYVGLLHYGILVLGQIILSGAALLDLGIGTSFTRFLAMYHGQQDQKRYNSVIATGVAFNLVLVCILWLTFYLFTPLLLLLLSVPNELQPLAINVFAVCLATFSLRTIIAPIIAVLNSLQRMDIAIRVGIACSVLSFIGLFLALYWGYGVLGVVTVQFAVSALHSLLCCVISFKLLPAITSTRFSSSSIETLKELFHYGIQLEVSRVSELVNFQFDKLLISAMLKLSLVSYYDLGASACKAVRDFPLNVLTPVLPAAAELQGLTDHQRINRLYRISSKYLSLLAIPSFLLLISSAPLIIYTWLGEGYQTATLVVQILSIGYLANILTASVSMMTQGLGYPELQMKQSLLQLLLNVVLSVSGIILFGFFGAVCATTISLIVGALYFFSLFHHKLSINLSAFAKQVFLRPALCSIIPASIIFSLNFFLIHPTSRIFSAAYLLAEAFLYFTIIGLALHKQSYLTEDEAKPLKDILGKLPKVA